MYKYYYYSDLDYINKYQISNLNETKNLIDSLEITIDSLEKNEALEHEDTELETLMVFFSLFSRSPKLVNTNSYDSGVVLNETKKKVQIYNKVYVSEILKFLFLYCDSKKRSLSIVSQKKNCSFLDYSFRLSYIKHYPQLPLGLLARCNGELSAIKVRIFLNQTKTKNYMDIFPLWRIPRLISNLPS